MTGSSQTEMVGYRCHVLIRCWYSSAVSLCSLWFGQKGILKCLWKGPWRLLDKYNSCYYFFVLTFLPHLNSPITQTIYFSKKLWGVLRRMNLRSLCCVVLPSCTEFQKQWHACDRFVWETSFLRRLYKKTTRLNRWTSVLAFMFGPNKNPFVTRFHPHLVEVYFR